MSVEGIYKNSRIVTELSSYVGYIAMRQVLRNIGTDVLVPSCCSSPFEYTIWAKSKPNHVPFGVHAYLCQW